MVERAVELARRADGEATTVEAAGRDPGDAAQVEAWPNAARQADWAEFLSDCAKFAAELDKEIGDR